MFAYTLNIDKSNSADSKYLNLKHYLNTALQKKNKLEIT